MKVFNPRKHSAYECGVYDARHHLSYARSTYHLSTKKLRAFSGKMHDKLDAVQFETRAMYGSKMSDYSRGKAMEYGMYSHTGKHIR